MLKERLEKRKITASFVASLGAGVQPRSTVQLFMPVSGVEKRPFSQFFSALGVIWRGKAFCDQQCHFLSRNNSLSSENESNCSMTSECVRTDSIFPQGAGLEHGRCKQSIFSLSIFGILVKRLRFWRLHFCSDFVTVFFIVFVYARAKICCYRFFNFDLRKKVKLRQSRPGRVKQCFWRFLVPISTIRAKLTRSLPRAILTVHHPGGQHFWQCYFRFWRKGWVFHC